ncbi:transporter [Janthinobacterium sp.]|uniref:transporter n=1 Tax=Janthinobacterium sp. TaxID=1871054 RepID=UPI00293D918A|nr:transporter [Janthinobacterium sp.]
MKTFTSISLLALCALAAQAQAQAPAPAQEEGGVSPYRPSVSSPAQLPLAGQLELELGVLATKSGAARRDSLPYTLKLAFNEQWGVLLGGEAYVGARDADGQRARGVGDTTLVLKRAFLLDSATALGLELGVKAPTAKDSIGSGRSDYSLNGIFSRDMGKVHMDANFNLSRLGAYEEGSARTQRGISASFALPVTEQWGATAELSGTRRRGADDTAQLLLAATYSPSKHTALDFGLARGLTSASPDWSLFGGVVVALGRLW